MKHRSKFAIGFKYTTELILPGGKVERHVEKNLVPIQGLDHFLNVALKAGTQFPNFYIGLYEGDYTPQPTDTMAAFPAAATELTAYAESTRRVLTLGDVVSGSVDNSLARAEFTGNVNGRQAMGGFISSSPTKGSSTGILISAVRFPSPRPLDAGGILRVTAAFTIVSV